MYQPHLFRCFLSQTLPSCWFGLFLCFVFSSLVSFFLIVFLRTPRIYTSYWYIFTCYMCEYIPLVFLMPISPPFFVLLLLLFWVMPRSLQPMQAGPGAHAARGGRRRTKCGGKSAPIRSPQLRRSHGRPPDGRYIWPPRTAWDADKPAGATTTATTASAPLGSPRGGFRGRCFSILGEGSVCAGGGGGGGGGGGAAAAET